MSNIDKLKELVGMVGKDPYEGLSSQEKKLAKLSSVIKMLDEGVTKEEFVSAFKAVVEQVKTIEADLIKVIGTRLSKADTEILDATSALKELKQEFQQAVKETRDANETTFANVKKRTIEAIDTLFMKMRLNDKFSEIVGKHEQMMKSTDNRMKVEMDKMYQEHEAMMAEMPDTEKMMEEMMEKMPPETPESVRDKLETLKGEEEYAPIKELRAEIAQIKKIPRGGGGTSALGVRQAFKYIAHTEAPVGDIDGVNTTYTVKNAIWWIAGFTLNGEQVAQLPNFTYAGNTITFTTAIPAIYSGKDFEIKYIG